jgi:hypothetical protein
MSVLLYTLGTVLILSYLLDLRTKGSKRQIPSGLLRVLLILPLLACAYLYFAVDMCLRYS